LTQLLNCVGNQAETNSNTIHHQPSKNRVRLKTQTAPLILDIMSIQLLNNTVAKSPSANGNNVGSQMEMSSSRINVRQMTDMENTMTTSRVSQHHPLPSTANRNRAPKVASPSNAMTVIRAPQTDHIPLSPLPHHGQRPSLAGFDPLLTSGGPSPSSYSQLSTSISGSTMDLHVIANVSSPTSFRYPALSSPPSPHFASGAAESGKKLVCLPQQTGSHNKGYPNPGRSSESATARHGPSQKRAERSNSSRDPSPTPVEGVDTRQPPTPSRSLSTPLLRTGRSRPSLGIEPILTNLPNDENSISINVPTPKSAQKINRDGRSKQPSPAARKLPFLRNKVGREGNENTKELSVTNDLPPSDQSQHPSSLSTSPTSVSAPPNANVVVDTKTSLIQELMDLKDKFSTLQIPSLAKPSPTSFLTGKGDEAVRTSEYEPSPFQIEFPSLPEVVEAARLNQFVENYRRMDQKFDLTDFIGSSRMDLQQVKIKQHVPIAQSLLECGEGLTIQGFISEGSDADERLEAVVVEGQRQFTVVFRGTTEQQTKLLGNSKPKKRGVPFDAEQENAEVYSGFKEEYTKLEHGCFSMIDKLSEQNPFCDFIFTGFSFGAAIATLAAYRYANARPTMRVGCLTFASPKVGFSLFRHLVNSLPNLKVFRLEHGQDAKCQAPSAGGWHVGHTLVLGGSVGQGSPKMQQTILAYKFDTPKRKKFKTTHPDLRTYVIALEELSRLNLPWVKDFTNTAGLGVVVNNETRQVV
jgi:Lipase (class 3)